VPCNEGFIEKRIYEKLAYPKQANWLYKSWQMGFNDYIINSIG
jgi:hypothetical protein